MRKKIIVWLAVVTMLLAALACAPQDKSYYEASSKNSTVQDESNVFSYNAGDEEKKQIYLDQMAATLNQMLQASETTIVVDGQKRLCDVSVHGAPDQLEEADVKQVVESALLEPLEDNHGIEELTVTVNQ